MLSGQVRGVLCFWWVQMSGTTACLREGSRVAGDTEQVPVDRMRTVRLASCPWDTEAGWEPEHHSERFKPSGRQAQPPHGIIRRPLQPSHTIYRLVYTKFCLTASTLVAVFIS